MGARPADPGRDEPGFWESLGYHNRGDQWLEERYSGRLSRAGAMAGPSRSLGRSATVTAIRRETPTRLDFTLALPAWPGIGPASTSTCG